MWIGHQSWKVCGWQLCMHPKSTPSASVIWRLHGFSRKVLLVKTTNAAFSGFLLSFLLTTVRAAPSRLSWLSCLLIKSSWYLRRQSRERGGRTHRGEGKYIGEQALRIEGSKLCVSYVVDWHSWRTWVWNRRIISLQRLVVMLLELDSITRWSAGSMTHE